jgi:hypothetical protein
MRIDVDGKKLVIHLPQKGESARQDFLHSTFGILYHEWRDSNTAVYDTEVFGLTTTAKDCRCIKYIAERLGFDITNGARALLEEIAEKHEELARANRIAEAEEMARKRAIFRVKQGCGFCPSLKWNGRDWECKKNGKRCATSAEEIERLFEEWKETKVFIRPTPFPNSECEFFEVLK